MTNKMLQATLDGQRAIKEELKKDISRVEKKVEGNAEGIKKNGERLDRLGKQLAYLEDDAPTNEEFDVLEKRVTKVESKLASV